MSTWSPTHRSALREREHAENFPVALGILPARLRTNLRAVYDVVRTIDELGDSADGDRTAQLEAFARDLASVWDGGEPGAAVLRGLVPTVRRLALHQEPFQALVAANLQDQHTVSYRTFEELLQYCMLSAAPIGRIVLEIFGVLTPERLVLSDRICAALQLVEHWQDVAEDRRAGRVYLPTDDLEHFGVRPTDLDADHASPALRHLIFFETDRAVAMLDSGAPLVGQLHGWARLAVAGYLAGGRAAVDSLHRVHGNLLGVAPQVRGRDVGRHLLVELRRAR